MKKAKEQLKIRKSNQLSTEVRSKAEEVRLTLGARLELVVDVPVTSVRECECEMIIYVCGLVVP